MKDSPKYWTDPIGTATQHEAFQLSDHMDYGDYAEVAAACKEHGDRLLRDPVRPRRPSRPWRRWTSPAHKIASADITHKPLLEAVAATSKPVFLATGASTLDEVKRAVDWMGLGPDKLVLLACTLTYPTPDPDGHFARIETYRREMAPYLIGMSDHTIGIAGAWMTAALGGVCIEKHYTIDPDLPGRPRPQAERHAGRARPRWSRRATAAPCCAATRGSASATPSSPRASSPAARSCSSATSPPAQPLTLDDLGFKRPGTGIAPFDYDRVIGRGLRDGGSAGTVLTEEALV